MFDVGEAFIDCVAIDGIKAIDGGKKIVSGVARC
jgi:hypothetical protein